MEYYAKSKEKELKMCIRDRSSSNPFSSTMRSSKVKCHWFPEIITHKDCFSAADRRTLIIIKHMDRERKTKFSMKVKFNIYVVLSSYLDYLQIYTLISTYWNVKIRFMPVSYTHLDVYKRQVIAFRGQPQHDFSKCYHFLSHFIYLCFLLQFPQLPLQGL